MEKQIIAQKNNTTDIDPTTEFITTVIKNNIKSFIRWGIIISSALMSITFIISWILWLTLFRDKINEIITIINKVITNKGIKLDLTFQILTIAILGFAIVTLAVTTFPFIFLKKKSTIALILGILMLVISALLITGTALFGSFGYCAFYHYVLSKDNIADILFFAIPVGLEMIYCIVLVIFCILLVFACFKNKKKTVELEIPIVNQKTKKNNSLDSQNISPFSQSSSQPILFNEPETVINPQNTYPQLSTNSLHLEPETVINPRQTYTNQAVNSQNLPNNTVSPQGINIVITNNTGSPQILEPPVLTSPIPMNIPVLNQQIPQPVVSNQPIANNNVTPLPNPQPSVMKNETLWTDQQIEDVWNKGGIISNFNPSLYRKDYAGALMYRNSFLNHVRLNDDVKSFNWTIVHQKPLTTGGTNDISNLVPLNNTNAISKGNNYPKWKTTVFYNGKENIFKEKSWKDKK